MATPTKPNTPQTAGTAAQMTPGNDTHQQQPTPVTVVPPVAPVIPPQTSLKAPSPIEMQPPFGGHAVPAQATSETTHDQASAPPPPARARVDGDERGPADTVLTVADEDYPLPAAYRGQPGVELLMLVCDLFGVDPNPSLPVFQAGKHVATATTKFRELMSWKFTPGDPMAGVADKVTIVTAGGRKLTVDSNGQFDSDTENVLRQAFQAFRVNPATNEKEPIALPRDLTLPVEAVLGVVMSDRHQYRRGYLREGGKREADRRAQEEQDRQREQFAQADDRRKAFMQGRR